ncbi:glycerol-3-phosphate 1-O-acyltransferase [Pseudonocardia sp.]|uniref:glycerol-3-phosphate 1-O-acyltransferase n=1 Tax=Pseudonocardia sp. TaxID=60912 RepID=UPI003D1336B5
MTASPAPDTASETLVLADVGTDVERALVRDWVRDTGVRADGVLPAAGSAIAGPLDAAAPDADVLAVRVAWLPRERNGQRRVRVTDLLSLVDPRRPPARAQARIARREPDRAVVVVAEPASVGELRERFAGHGAGGFGDFVARQARLALDRAERALVGGRYKVPKRIVEDIRASAQFRAGVAELAARLGRTPDDIAAAAGEDLDALVASMSPLAVDMLSGVLRPLHSRAWKVEVETSGLAELRELNRGYPLVFLPSHRSYADPLLLADVLAEHDFPRNHVLGGDNLRFWPLAPLAKRAGIVFIRRSFGDDEVYKFAVREYFGFLLAKRFNLEWYMEGGRSRTGKLRPPRYGLLANVAEALDRGRAQDAYLVPVSITYDQLREVAAMAAEQRGAAKKGEGLSWLASYARAQLSPIGTAYVRFGLPISLRGALEPGLESGPGTEGPDGRRLALQKAAFEVAVGINAVTPVIATSLVTLTLLGVRDRALTLPQVARVLRPVREYVLERGLPHATELLDTEEGLRRVLAELTAERVVTTYTGGEEAVFAIERGQHLVAAFYRNSSIHHFVNRAIAELMLLCPPAERAAEAARLRDLLKFEFFFPDRATHAEQLAAELTRLGADGAGPEGRVLLEKAGFLIAHRVLRSFLDAQLVVASRLVSLGDRPPGPEKEFLDATAGLGQQLLLQGRLHGPESLSRELFASALKLADNQGLLDGADLAARRARFAERVEDVVARVTTIDEIDAATRQEAAGVEP